MIELFNTSINIHSLKESDITIDDCLNELYRSALVVKKLRQHDQIWYLTGYSKKDASKHVVFSDNEPNQNTIDTFERYYKKSSFN